MKRRLVHLTAVAVPLLILHFATDAYSGTIAGMVLTGLGPVAYAGAGVIGHLTATSLEYALDLSGYPLS